MKLNLNVKAIVIVRQKSGTDHITFEFEGPSTFPELDKNDREKYPPFLKIDCRIGYAEEWLRLIGFKDGDWELIVH